MRTKAPPPMSAREAVQGHRAKHSVSPIGDGAPDLSEARAIPRSACTNSGSAVISFIIASALHALGEVAARCCSVDRD